MESSELNEFTVTQYDNQSMQICVGGYCIRKPIIDWHKMAKESRPSLAVSWPDKMLHQFCQRGLGTAGCTCGADAANSMHDAFMAVITQSKI